MWFANFPLFLEILIKNTHYFLCCLSFIVLSWMACMMRMNKNSLTRYFRRLCLLLLFLLFLCLEFWCRKGSISSRISKIKSYIVLGIQRWVNYHNHPYFMSCILFITLIRYWDLSLHTYYRITRAFCTLQ